MTCTNLKIFVRMITKTIWCCSVRSWLFDMYIYAHAVHMIYMPLCISITSSVSCKLTISITFWWDRKTPKLWTYFILKLRVFTTPTAELLSRSSFVLSFFFLKKTKWKFRKGHVKPHNFKSWGFSQKYLKREIFFPMHFFNGKNL